LPAITIERIERAIRTVARAMVRHDMNLAPTIRRLEAERDRLQQDGSDMDYAREILARSGRNIGRNIADLESV
jgi:hypothetical protein